MLSRKDPRSVAVAGGSEADVRRFIESDYKIRQGLCPNDCGLMSEDKGTQVCPKCSFSTNAKAEKGAPC